MNTCVHVVNGTAWAVEALAGLGISFLCIVLVLGVCELLRRFPRIR